MTVERTLEDDIEASLENLSDGEATVGEHVALLVRDHHVTTDEAIERLILGGGLFVGVCTTCGHGRRGDPWGNPNRCSYCGDDYPVGEHRHQFGMRVDGLARCVGRKYLGCDAEDYDSQWGAGIFNDWPRGSHKPYGA